MNHVRPVVERSIKGYGDVIDYEVLELRKEASILAVLGMDM